MTENGPQPASGAKRMTPIVQETRTRSIVSGGRDPHVRRAGSRRQLRIAIFVVVVIAGLLTGAYFLFFPSNDQFKLTNFNAATVAALVKGVLMASDLFLLARVAS